MANKVAGANIIPKGFIQKDHLKQVDAREYAIDLANVRVWDAVSSILPATAANDDLGIVTGTFGTNAVSIQTGNLATAGATTRYGRFEFVLPPEYVAGESVSCEITCVTTQLADTSASIDLVVYKRNGQLGVGSDLCATSALDANNGSPTAETFTITPTTLSPGDILDCRVAYTVTDAAGSSVIGKIDSIKFLLDVKG